MTDKKKEPETDWQLAYMQLAKEFCQFILNVYTMYPEFRETAHRMFDEMVKRNRQQTEDEIRFLFHRYDIEDTVENRQRFDSGYMDFYGNCVDHRDCEDGRCFAPSHPTDTMIHLYSILWSGLLDGKKKEKAHKLLEHDLHDPDFQLPGDHTETEPSFYYQDEDREDAIARGVKYVDCLARLHTFCGLLKGREKNIPENLESLGILSDRGWGSMFQPSSVNTWLSWYRKH